MQGISVEKVDVVELDKLCKRVADDVKQLFEMFDAEKSIRVEQDGVVVAKSVPVYITPDGGGVMVKLGGYDYVSVGPDGLLLDVAACSLYVGNDVQLYKPFKRQLTIGKALVWEGAERPYTAEEFRQNVAQRLANIMLSAVKKLGQA